MNQEFRKGWRAACAAVAERLRRDLALASRAPGYAADLADHIEATPPPKTMTVVDERGERLL